MNALEKIGLQKLLEELHSTLERCHEANVNRMEHERVFIKGGIERAIKIAKALDENNTKHNE